MHLKIPPLVLIGIFAALMFALSWLSPQLTFALPIKNLLAIFIASLGVLICAMGGAAFRRAKTTVDPRTPKETSSLVVHGIYRVSRNPMYVGFLLMIISWAAYLANGLALFHSPLLESKERGLENALQMGDL